MTTPLLLCDFAGDDLDTVWAHILEEWEAPPTDRDRFEILIAFLENEGYEGSGYFLIKERATGDLYETWGSHCSCNSFEGDWTPQIAPLAYLKGETYSAKIWNKEAEAAIAEYLAAL